MGESIRLVKKPKLHHPSFIAAWPGMGRVALLAVEYLRDHLKAEFLGEMEHTDFFAPTGAQVSKQVILTPEKPTNRFYYYSSPSGERDILFFLGSQQPIPHKEYEFARDIVLIAKTFDSRILYTTAAAPSDMHFKNKSRVFAAPNNTSLLKVLLRHDVNFMGEGSIAGMNGLLISVAAQHGLDGVCILGEIPFFTAQVEFPRASMAILKVLTRLLEVDIDFVDLEIYASEKDKEIEPLASILGKEPDEAESPKLGEGIIPAGDEKVPKVARLTIEKLFRQAEFDRTYKSKMRLKEELDKWELFNEYLDRFLDLFKKSQGES